MHEPEALHLLSGSDASRLLRGILALGAVVVVGAFGLIGYAVGSDGGVTHLTGSASVGNRVASIRSEGTYYGVSESVAWVDAAGSVHDEGWPECFEGVGRDPVRVRFGAVTVRLPDDGGSVTSLVYVDCRDF
jgi:hypothetical protein